MIKKIFLSTILFLIFNSIAIAKTMQEARFDFGKEEYQARCASCHGKTGKGNGPLSSFLKDSPTDITTLAKKNDGILPIERIFQSISGENIPYHGTRDMPIWGDIYFYEANCIYGDMPLNTNSYVRGKILSLIEYINRLQIK